MKNNMPKQPTEGGSEASDDCQPLNEGFKKPRNLGVSIGMPVFSVVIAVGLLSFPWLQGDPSPDEPLFMGQTGVLSFWNHIWFVAILATGGLLVFILKSPKKWAVVTSCAIVVASFATAFAINATPLAPSAKEQVQGWVEGRYGLHVTEAQAEALMDKKRVKISGETEIRLLEIEKEKYVIVAVSDEERTEFPTIKHS